MISQINKKDIVPRKIIPLGHATTLSSIEAYACYICMTSEDAILLYVITKIVVVEECFMRWANENIQLLSRSLSIMAHSRFSVDS